MVFFHGRLPKWPEVINSTMLIQTQEWIPAAQLEPVYGKNISKAIHDSNHLICLICQTKASSLLWAKCWLLNHRVLKEYPDGRELHLTYAYQRLVALAFNGSISQQKLQMRSQPLNMDDELWASWVWIIHMQRDCRTMLEWLHHSWNKGLINKYTQLWLWLSSAQASADSIAQRKPSQPFRQGDGSHLKWPVILYNRPMPAEGESQHSRFSLMWQYRCLGLFLCICVGVCIYTH